MNPAKASRYSGGIFDFDSKVKRIQELEEQSAQSNFWNDNERAQAVLREINALKAWTESWKSLHAKHGEIRLLFELGREEGDESVVSEIQEEIEKLRAGVENLEFRRMLDGEDDHRNAIMTIHPGAGGTESQDWAQMLFRMYLRYAERKGYSVTLMDTQDGEEAGLKSATLEVKGSYAFGFLKAEAGVHRLVRISPFDSNKRRHTSFASIFVYPELEDDIQIVVNPNDLRIDTYRASGAGGQHVNKTSSAVRITHIP
ncbi:PCRF domain-containing protein, partial [bacterium]|nr:PCRF domain-containing protein [bacterium]